MTIYQLINQSSPELIVMGTILVLGIGHFVLAVLPQASVSMISFLGLALACFEQICSFLAGETPGQRWLDVFVMDKFSAFFKILLMATGLLQIAGLLLIRPRNIQASGPEVEWPQWSGSVHLQILLLAQVLAGMLLVSSSDLIVCLFCMILMISCAIYQMHAQKMFLVLVESSIKLFFGKFVSVIFFLLAISLLFIATQKLELGHIQAVIQSGFAAAGRRPDEHGLQFMHLIHVDPAVLMLSAFFLFLVVLVHWIDLFPGLPLADFLQGSASWIWAFLVLSFRFAGLGFGSRLLLCLFSSSSGGQKITALCEWPPVLLALAGVSMLLPALLAITQTSVKRLLGYILMSQSGFYIMALSLLDFKGIEAMLFNIVIELLAVFGIFFSQMVIFPVYAKSSTESIGDDFEDYHGLLYKNAFASCGIIAFMCMLIGLPPTIGFIGKFTLIGVAVSQGRLWVAAVALLSMLFMSVGVFRLSFQIMRDCVPDLKKPQQQAQTGSFEKSFFRLNLPVHLSELFLWLLWVPVLALNFWSDALFAWVKKAFDLV
jgi:NADH-quinone oxidoreductase subunit N